jgi:hypothetical protein
MSAAAQGQTAPTATDPVQRWLARRSAGAPPSKELISPTPSLPATYSKAPANSAEAQRARRAPLDGSRTASRRAPFCASSSEARTGPVRPSRHSGTPAGPAEHALFQQRSVVRASSSEARSRKTPCGSPASPYEPHPAFTL